MVLKAPKVSECPIALANLLQIFQHPVTSNQESKPIMPSRQIGMPLSEEFDLGKTDGEVPVHWTERTHSKAALSIFIRDDALEFRRRLSKAYPRLSFVFCRGSLTAQTVFADEIR
jgi:hypothetical protein